MPRRRRPSRTIPLWVSDPPSAYAKEVEAAGIPLAFVPGRTRFPEPGRPAPEGFEALDDSVEVNLRRVLGSLASGDVSGAGREFLLGLADVARARAARDAGRSDVERDAEREAAFVRIPGAPLLRALMRLFERGRRDDVPEGGYVE
jgi:hypothetical protein